MIAPQDLPGSGGLHPRAIGDCPILIVDDTEVNRTLIAAMLRQGGFRRIDHAADGAEALARIAADKPDLVILDILMPEMDGFEVCRRIRADPACADLPVIVQTILCDTDDRNRVFAAGSSDLITKPIDRQELLARVRIHLENRVLIQDLQLFRARLEGELGLAREMIDHLLPGAGQLEALARDIGFQVHHHQPPSADLAGGAWGLLPLPCGRIAVFQFEIGGGGVSAALNVFRLHGLIHELTPLAGEPSRFLAALNASAVALFTAGERAHLVYGLFDPATGRFIHASAGAARPLLLRAGGGPPQVSLAELSLNDAVGDPIGTLALAGFVIREFSLAAGDILILPSLAACRGLARGTDANGAAVLAALLADDTGNGFSERVALAVARIDRRLDGLPQDDAALLFLGWRGRP
jgi:sigma-B regulation protein RsbU (phosphoserine phosphatase)